jgi:hypothetical protein
LETEAKNKKAETNKVESWLSQAASRPETTTGTSQTQSEFLIDKFIELDGAMGQLVPEAALSLATALCTALLKLSTGAHKARQSADVTMSYVVELVCTVRTSLKLYSSSRTAAHAKCFVTTLEQADLWDLASRLRTALQVPLTRSGAVAAGASPAQQSSQQSTQP